MGSLLVRQSGLATRKRNYTQSEWGRVSKGQRLKKGGWGMQYTLSLQFFCFLQKADPVFRRKSLRILIFPSHTAGKLFDRRSVAE
jgi:hypothetical protein